MRRGWSTFGITLEPGNAAGLGTVCASAGICETVNCIAGAGRNRFAKSKTARYKRTVLYKQHPAQFFAQVQAEITLWAIQQQAQGFKLAGRPNVLSDLPVMAQTLARAFPQVMFYDYTKHPRPASRRLENYHLTYSYSENTTAADLAHCVDHRVNVAVVFAVKKSERLPRSITLHGRRFAVLDGDVSDLRFLDKSDKAYVIGLRWKHSPGSADKLARAVEAGYVIDPQARFSPATLAA
jgi:hypothetical protein